MIRLLALCVMMILLCVPVLHTAGGAARMLSLGHRSQDIAEHGVVFHVIEMALAQCDHCSMFYVGTSWFTPHSRRVERHMQLNGTGVHELAQCTL